MVDEAVEVEFVDVAGVELGEPGAHAVEKSSQLRLVVCRDQFLCCAALRLLAGQIPSVPGPGLGVDPTTVERDGMSAPTWSQIGEAVFSPRPLAASTILSS